MSELPIAKIKPNLWNPNRMDEDTYRSLVNDIRANGVGTIDPIHVRPLGKDFSEVIDGEHRLRAVGEAGFDKIPCLIDEVSEEEAKAINYRKNKERGNMDPFREAELFKSEIDKGKTYDEIAEKYGISHAQVGARLSLLGISDDTRKIVTRVTKSGKKVTTTHLELIAPLPKPIQSKIAEKLKDEPSTRELTKEIEKEKAGPQAPPKPEIAPEPIFTDEEYICPVCGASYNPFHISKGEHRFDLAREGKDADNKT